MNGEQLNLIDLINEIEIQEEIRQAKIEDMELEKARDYHKDEVARAEKVWTLGWL